MKFLYIFFIVFTTISSSLFSQSRWLQEYFPGLNIVGQDFVESYDNGYIMTGKYGQDYVHFLWMIKTDINGQILWGKTFGEPDSYISFYKLDLSQRGEIFLSGATSYFDPSRDPIIMKLNSCGDKEWCLIFSTPNHFDYAISSVATNDGGCTVLLSYTGISYQTERICIAKIDSLGNLSWKQCYNSLDSNITNQDGHSLLRTPDRGYLISGSCTYLDTLTNLYWKKPYLIKTDSMGNFQWERVIHAFDTNHTGGIATYSIIDPTEQFYYISISHYYYNPERECPALGKIDLLGNVLGIYDIIQGYNNGGASSAQFINDSTLAVDCGWGNSLDDFGHYVALVDTLGNIKDTILLSQDIYSGVLHLCHDNKLVDMYKTYQNNQFHIYMRKLNYNLEDDTLYTLPFTYDSLCPYQIVSDTIVQDDCGLIVGVEEPGSGDAGKPGGMEAWGHGGMEIWPNPAKTIVNCQLSTVDCQGDLTLVIYDIFGREVVTLPPNGGRAGDGGRQSDGDGGSGWQINVETFPPGVYIAILKNGPDIIESRKFVVAR